MSYYSKNKQILVSLDTEVSCLDPDLGVITEIGMIVLDCEKNKILQRYETLVKPYKDKYKVDPKSMEISGINFQDCIDKGKDAKEVIQDIEAIIEKKTVIGWNVFFDIRHLMSMYKIMGVERDWYCIDVKSMYDPLSIFNVTQNSKQVTIAEYMGVKYSGAAHRALNDCIVTAELFIKASGLIKRQLSNNKE